MTDTLQTRIPTLSDAELRRYLENHLDYQTEAVELVLAELGRRDLALPSDDLNLLRASLTQREAATRAERESGYDRILGRTPEATRSRIRLITTGILAAGFGSAILIYVSAPARTTNPLGYDPMDTKKYLRDLELYGGKVNVLATEFMHWWQGLWQGRNLAVTVATLTALLALGFWLLASRHTTQEIDDFE